MKILLIRHGETKSNIERIYSGWSDVLLNKNGIKQAKKLANFLSNKKIHKIYSSDLKRAKEFSKIAFGNRKIHLLPELREINFGDFEGLKHEEIISLFPKEYKTWLKNPKKASIPNGENLTDLKKRVMSFFKKIKGTNDHTTIAVISHAGPIKAIVAHAKKSANFWTIKIDNASVSIIYLKNGRIRAGKINNITFLK